jgi:TnpA family transposase
MKQYWEDDELTEHFLIDEEDILLTKGFTHINKLSFLVFLKYFQLEARFPLDKDEIPNTVLTYIANQLRIDEDEFKKYDFAGRTCVRHRNTIRNFFSFSEYSAKVDEIIYKNLGDFGDWHNFDKLKTKFLEEYRKLKTEPPITNQLERLLKAYINRKEKELFKDIDNSIPDTTKEHIDYLLKTLEENEYSDNSLEVTLNELKSDPGRIGLESIFKEIAKLEIIRSIGVPSEIFSSVKQDILQNYKLRVASELISELRAHPNHIKYTYLSIFLHIRSRQITDNLVELLIQLIHKISSNAENRVVKEFVKDFKKVGGKFNILLRIAENSLQFPDETIRNVIYPVAKEETLRDLVAELKNNNGAFKGKVFKIIKNSYSRHYRRMLPAVLGALEFKSNNLQHRPVIKALHLIKESYDTDITFFRMDQGLPIDGIMNATQKKGLLSEDNNGQIGVDKKEYEITVLQALRDKLRCKEIWVKGSDKFKNPELDLPQDFERKRNHYYSSLNKPKDPDPFIEQLQGDLSDSLRNFNDRVNNNPHVRISSKNGGKIILTPFEKQEDPKNIELLKQDVAQRWPMIDLLDILKEVDMQINFTEQIHTMADREIMDALSRRKRLLLVLFGLGTNTGLKRMSNASNGEFTYSNLRYIKRKYLNKDNLRNANIQVVNHIQKIRLNNIWGEGSTSCASDSKKFGSWDQNLMTEWHLRYRGRGVMIYWHVEKKSTCVYSQLKSVSSSEVASMIEGILNHRTDFDLDKNYVDTHGQSEIAFAFSHLLNFSLMPRFKTINKKKLYITNNSMKEELKNLTPILTRSIDWDLIKSQYDQMIKYSTALKIGTASAEAILKRFTRNSIQHPTYKALQELGKVIKTIFLSEYLSSKDMRIEINQGLNVVENWNSANGFIFYGKSGEISTNNLEDQEISVLCLHLLQNCLVYVNTLMIQRVLNTTEWQEKMGKEDFRALTPLIYNHINPYGRFELDLNKRLNLAV